MRNIMQALNTVPDGGAKRNPFDLSAFHSFSQKGGMLNVVGVVDTVPNSNYKMSVDGFTRSLPCNTANFARIKENYYFVHVPLGLISRNAYQTMVNREQSYSALGMGITQFPVFPLGDVVYRCLEISQLSKTSENAKYFDIHGFNIGAGALRLLDMCGYGSYIDFYEAVKNGQMQLGPNTRLRLICNALNAYKPTANRLAAYQCIWYNFFRNDIYDNEITARIYNFDDVTYKTGSSEPNYDITQVRSLDDFIIDCCQLRYVGYKKDIFTASMPGTQFGAVSTVPVDVQFDVLSAQFVGDSVTPTGSFSGTEDFVIGGGDTVFSATFPQAGPNDGNRASGVTGSDVDILTGADGRWKHNASGLDPAPIQMMDGYSAHLTGGDRLEIGPNSQGLTTVVGHDHTFSVPDHGHNVSLPRFKFIPSGSISINSFTPSGTVDLSGGVTGSSLFDVLSLVEAQAIQKWRQKSMLAGNKTADQFRAHHGVVPRHLIDHLPDFIGSVDNEIQITEVTSQADTASSADESNLGEIAGRGYGASNNKSFYFQSDDYGVLFLLKAIVPENTYSSFGLDMGNTMVYYSDFYQSEYQNIGLQPVPKFTCNAAVAEPSSNPSGTGTDTFTQDVGIIGYAPRYFGYKQYPSKVHGLFNPNRLGVYSGYSPSPYGYSDMQSFVVTRQDMVGVDANLQPSDKYLFELNMGLTNLYVNPSIFNSIFAMDADDSQTTDEFISHVKFEIVSSLPMSVIGIPQF